MLNTLISDSEARGNCGGQGRQLPAARDTRLGQGTFQDFFTATIKKLSELGHWYLQCWPFSGCVVAPELPWCRLIILLHTGVRRKQLPYEAWLNLQIP